MKVLMFGWEFPPYISGGLGTACFGLTQGLLAKGADITFVLPKLVGPTAPGPMKIVGANHVHLRYASAIKKLQEKELKFVEVFSSLKPYLTETSYVQQMEQFRDQEIARRFPNPGLVDVSSDYSGNLIDEVGRYATIGAILGADEEHDVIHAHDWMTFLAGIEAKKQSKKPLVVHVHSTEFDRSGDSPNPDIYWIEKQGMDAADYIIAVSQRTKDIIVQRYHQQADKVTVVHNAITKEPGIAKENAGKLLKEKIVLFLGRVTVQKGPDYFLEAASIVHKKLKNVRFVMAGVGDMLPRMIERAAALRIHDRFHFTGFLRGVERERIFAMSDVYVMPSVSEPFGLTPYEVMKYGVPVILSKQSGITEVVENAIKVDFWDIQKLAGAIISVLTDSQVSQSLSEGSAREWAEVDWSTAADKVNDLYYRAVGLA